MIVALMMYTIAVSLLLGAAAAASERLLRLVRQPSRFIWLAAMIVAIAISGVRFRETLSPAIGAVSDVAVQDVLDTVPTQPAATRSASQSPSTSNSRASLGRVFGARLDAVRIRVGAKSQLENWNRPLVVGWAVASLLAFMVIGISAFRLARPRPRWSNAMVNGVPVLV